MLSEEPFQKYEIYQNDSASFLWETKGWVSKSMSTDTQIFE